MIAIMINATEGDIKIFKELFPANDIQTIDGPDTKPTTPLISRITAIELLKAKGYRCSSYQALKALCYQFNIDSRKIGNDLWYNREDINRVPSKK